MLKTLLRETICLPVLLLCILLQSCSGDAIYSEKADIGDDGWSYADSIRFAFDAPDTTGTYGLWLGVHHDPEYAWENAYVRIRTDFPSDSSVVDVVSLELTDGMGGWMGRCSGNTCHVDIPLRVNVKFPAPGTYALTFVQYMRQDVVPGIYGLTFQVKRHEG